MTDRLPDDACRQAAELYSKRVPIGQIAARVGRSRSRVYDAIRRGGGCVRTISESGRKYTVDEAAFETLTPEAEYWVGFLMADGAISPSNRPGSSAELCLDLSDRDAEHVWKFARFLKTDAEPSSHRGRFVRLRIRSQPIASQLASYGVVPRKTGAERADPRLAFSRHFWRGVVDGDGCVVWRAGPPKRGTNPPRAGMHGFPIVQLVSASRGLIVSFERYVRSLGISTGAAPRLATSGIWGATVASRGALRLLTELYQGDVIALARKHEKAKWIIDNYRPLRQWSDADIAFIAGKRSEGVDWGSIADALGVTRASAMRAFSRMGS